MRRFLPWAPWAVCLFLLACGDSYERPDIPDGGPAPGPQCSMAVPCAAGGVCLGGRCYPPCGPTSCAAGEVCNMGICMPIGAAPPPVPPPPPPIDGGPDVGPIDGGNPDAGDGSSGLCATAMCTAPMMCDPADGMCVECSMRECDGSDTATCDVASGRCGSFTREPCAPCDEATDCLPGSQCVASTSPIERTCLPSCAAGACPLGMRCDDRMLCVPNLGSCTERYRATQNLSCMTDVQCTPRGAGMLMRCVLGICRAPCATAADCPIEGAECFAGVCAGG